MLEALGTAVLAIVLSILVIVLLGVLIVVLAVGGCICIMVLGYMSKWLEAMRERIEHADG